MSVNCAYCCSFNVCKRSMIVHGILRRRYVSSIRWCMTLSSAWCMDDRSPVIASSAYFDVISPVSIVFVFCRFVWVWKIIVIWEYNPKRRDIASLDCDENPLKQELSRVALNWSRWFSFRCRLWARWLQSSRNLLFQSELNKIVSNTQLFVFFCFRTSHLVSRRPAFEAVDVTWDWAKCGRHGDVSC